MHIYNQICIEYALDQEIKVKNLQGRVWRKDNTRFLRVAESPEPLKILDSQKCIVRKIPFGKRPKKPKKET